MDKLYYKYYSHYTERHGRLSAVASQYYRQKEFSLGSDIDKLAKQYIEYVQKIENETNPAEKIIQKTVLKQIADEIIKKFNETLIKFPHKKEAELNIISNLHSDYIINEINKLTQPPQETQVPRSIREPQPKHTTDYQPIPYSERQKRELDLVHKEPSTYFPYSQSPSTNLQASSVSSPKVQVLSQHRGSLAERMKLNQQRFLPPIN